MNKPANRVRPYPWKCRNCGKIAVHPAVVTYEVDIEYEGKAYHVVTEKLPAPQCRECHSIYPDAQANRLITAEFRRQARILSPGQIRQDRESLGLTQKQLANALGCAEATISRWETGSQIQQRSSDNFLRVFFGIPAAREALTDDARLQRLGFVATSAQLAGRNLQES
ncbi:MAG TPA: type II TA system antitoxin MqsA family protein [Gemmataceae bacterium]|nr:type II TA system antitoxin MqsA family protein [Gemmataceae bacterium]